jgi:hypothetical protein
MNPAFLFPQCDNLQTLELVVREDKDLPVVDVKTLEERTSAFTAQVQPGAKMFSAFAALALLLSAVGIYGWKRIRQHKIRSEAD